MSIKKLTHGSKHYILIVAATALTWYLAQIFSGFFKPGHYGESEFSHTLPVLLSIVAVFALGYAIFELSRPTVIPSFVLAIFFGIAAKPVLATITENPTVLGALTTIGALLILFGGGLETPYTTFRTLVGPILSIAVFGTLIHAFLLAAALPALGGMFGFGIGAGAAVLLGAALASTDPAAIIPSLKSLRFKDPRVKYIAVSESAINDVVGAVLTGLFLALLTGGKIGSSVAGAYAALVTGESMLLILKVAGFGALAGLAGFGILVLWDKWMLHREGEGDSDSAFFIAVPLLTFALAAISHGSGYLAVFLAGLFFQLRRHVRHVEHYFAHTIDGLLKPMIFMLLGATVDVHAMLSIAPLGIAVGLLFMLIRPLVVFSTLWPFTRAKMRLTTKELLFLSFVRETGVIPAVLLVGISASGIDGASTITAVGLWVILLTLIVQPPLTPLVAKSLGLAEDIAAVGRARKYRGPVAVLATTHSFPERLEIVTAWCQEHNVENIVLLYAPEARDADTVLSVIRREAEALFQATRNAQRAAGTHEMKFEFFPFAGAFADGIAELVEHEQTSIIFVGSKILQYRVDEVRRMGVPFYFLS